MDREDGFEIEFYETADGVSEMWNFLEELRLKSATNKNSRIQFKQISLYIELLRKNGSTLPKTIMKHIEDDIWELRPGSNRIFYFYYSGNGRYILLHHFRKSTQKTPKKEIEKAKREKADYISRRG